MILVIDGNILLMSSVMVWRHKKKLPLSYFILMQVFKYVKEFHPSEVFIAADGGSSWRKAILPSYKKQRKDFRDLFPDIDWSRVFATYTQLLQDIQELTNIVVVHIPFIEGDDIISYICKYYRKKIIIVSRDKDLKQLLIYPHVSLCYITPRKKKKYEMLTYDDDELGTFSRKTTEGDKSDQIPKATSFPELVRNSIIVDLIHLPVPIELSIQMFLSRVSKNVNKHKFLEKYNFKPIRTMIESGRCNNVFENRNSTTNYGVTCDD